MDEAYAPRLDAGARPKLGSGAAVVSGAVEPIVVEVTRGEVVEARHVVDAVVVRDGRIELAAGDPRLVVYFRSSAKPLQALPVVRARPDLDDEEVALMCSSHLATDEQIAIVRRLLADAPATEDDLECGPEPTRIEHNCSGKHAGFLALCRREGWPIDGYRLSDHPCQLAVAREIAEAADVPAESMTTAPDGCGVPTFALPLERMAHAFTRLWSLPGAETIVRAMRARPDLLRGPVAADARFIQVVDGWVAKGGAEGLFCASSAEGVGIALKVGDGAFRAIPAAAAHVLSLLGLDPGALATNEVTNSRGETVGELRVAGQPGVGHL
jgi:L-asparaginase